VKAPPPSASDAATATAWIDAYLDNLPEDQRESLQNLRRTVADAAPEAVEAVSYGIPAFSYKGRTLVWYHAARNHCSLFPTAEPIEAFRSELGDFKLAKGTIKFIPARPIAAELVAKLVRYRIEQIDTKKSRDPQP